MVINVGLYDCYCLLSVYVNVIIYIDFYMYKYKVIFNLY